MAREPRGAKLLKVRVGSKEGGGERKYILWPDTDQTSSRQLLRRKTHQLLPGRKLETVKKFHLLPADESARKATPPALSGISLQPRHAAAEVSKESLSTV